MVAAELAVGIIFVAVCVSIPPCLLVFSSSIERFFVLRSKFAPAELDTDTEDAGGSTSSGSDDSGDEKTDRQRRDSNPRRRHARGAHHQATKG